VSARAWAAVKAQVVVEGSRPALLTQRRALGLIVDADLDTLAIALYVRVDDLLTHPERAPWRPEVGIAPKITDAELVTLAVMARLSNRSTRPSKAISTSNSRVAVPSPACSSASGSDYSP
jgi:cobalamin biosynthesis protein CbiG